MHLIQPCDGFIVKKLTSIWTNHCKVYKMDKTIRVQWNDSAGRIRIAGKSCFLQLAASFVRELHQEKYEDLVLFVRRVMCITGVAINTNGLRETQQLSPEL